MKFSIIAVAILSLFLVSNYSQTGNIIGARIPEPVNEKYFFSISGLMIGERFCVECSEQIVDYVSSLEGVESVEMDRKGMMIVECDRDMVSPEEIEGSIIFGPTISADFVGAIS